MTGRGSTSSAASSSKKTHSEQSSAMSEELLKGKMLNKLERDVRALQRQVAGATKQVRQTIVYSETTQTPFIKERLHNSFEVGYTLARDNLDDKCLEIFNVPGVTGDEEKKFMDIMEESEAEYNDLTGIVNEAMARIIASITEDTPPREGQPNPVTRVKVAAPPAPAKPRMTLTKETPPRQMEQFLAAFKMYTNKTNKQTTNL